MRINLAHIARQIRRRITVQFAIADLISLKAHRDRLNAMIARAEKEKAYLEREIEKRHKIIKDNSEK